MRIRLNYRAGKNSVSVSLAHWRQIRLYCFVTKRPALWTRKRQNKFLKLLKRINKEFNITILLVTHEINVIQEICNRVAVMEHGRVVEMGTVLDVFSHPTQSMTKRFVQTVIPERIPDNVVAQLKADTRPYELVKLRFLGDAVTKNVIYEVNRKFNVETNIVFASVNQLQDSALGIFILQVVGAAADLDAAKKYMCDAGLECEVITL